MTSPLPRALTLTIILLACWSETVGQTPPEPISLGPRVGAELDSLERTYFGLLPDVTGAALVRAFETDSGHVVFERTELPYGTDTVAVVSSETVRELSRYLNGFERLHRSREVNWQLLYQVARPVRRLRSGERVEVTTRNGARVQGHLVYAGEQGVVLSEAADPGVRVTDLSQARAFASGDIVAVRDQRSWGRRLLWTFVIPDAGNADVYDKHTLPVLRKLSTLRSAPSPEVAALLADFAERTPSLDEGYASSDIHTVYPDLASGDYRASISILPSPTVVRPSGYTLERLVGSPLARAVNLSPPAVLLRLERPTARRVWFGATLDFAPRGRSILVGGTYRAFDAEAQDRVTQQLESYPGYVHASATTVGVLASLPLKRVGPNAFLIVPTRSIMEQVALTVSAGLTASILSTAIWPVSLSYGATGGGAYPILTYEAPVRSRSIAPGARVVLEGLFHMTRNLSYGVSAQSWFVPQVRVQERSVNAPNGQRRVVPGFTSSIQSTSIAVQIGFRL